jgi:uridine kinase
MNDKIIISICGPAGAGKSTLAKKLVIALGRNLASRVPADYYLKSYNGEPFEEFISTPFKFDWDLLKKELKKPIGASCETPDFDFHLLVRKSKTGGIPFMVNRYMIIDSLPYPESDYVIKLEAPADLRMSRIKERDNKDKTNSMRNWEKMEVTGRELENGKYKFDLILSGFDEPEVNAEKIVEFINQTFAQNPR